MTQLAVIILCLGCVASGKKCQFTRPLTNPQRKENSCLSPGILLVNFLDHIFQSENLRTFQPRKTDRAFNVRRSSILLNISILGKLLSFWRGVNVTYDTNWFLWLFHYYSMSLSQHWREQNSNMLRSALYFAFLSLSLGFCAPNTNFLSFCQSWHKRGSIIRKMIVHKKP